MPDLDAVQQSFSKARVTVILAKEGDHPNLKQIAELARARAKIGMGYRYMMAVAHSEQELKQLRG